MAAVIEPLRVGRGVVGDVNRGEAAGFCRACDVGDGCPRTRTPPRLDRWVGSSREYEMVTVVLSDARRDLPGAGRGSRGCRRSARLPWRAGRIGARRAPT